MENRSKSKNTIFIIISLCLLAILQFISISRLIYIIIEVVYAFEDSKLTFGLFLLMIQDILLITFGLLFILYTIKLFNKKEDSLLKQSLIIVGIVSAANLFQVISNTFSIIYSLLFVVSTTFTILVLYFKNISLKITSIVSNVITNVVYILAIFQYGGYDYLSSWFIAVFIVNLIILLYLTMIEEKFSSHYHHQNNINCDELIQNLIEAKELFDSGLISKSDFEKIKNSYLTKI